MVSQGGTNHARRGERRPARFADTARWVGEAAAYWLLYIVAFTAVWWHWSNDNHLLAVLCAGAVLLSARYITQGRTPQDGAP